MVGGKLVLVLVLVGLVGVGAVEDQEFKPNNYANFEFHESPKQVDASEVTKPVDGKLGSFEFAETTPGGVDEREEKTNNYKDFKFTEEDAHNEFAKGEYHGSTTSFDASDRFGERGESFSAQDEVVYGDQQGPATYQVGESEYRGSDPSNRYPSSYELLNAQKDREIDHEAAGYQSEASNEVRFTNARHANKDVDASSDFDDHPVTTTPSQTDTRRGSSRFYTPASDPDFAFRFAKPDANTFGSNEYRPDNQADQTVYSQFNFDNSDATNDPTATYGTTTPVLAASNSNHNVNMNQHSPASTSTSGHGCGNMYWAVHTKEWPSFFTVNTQATQAFGKKAGEIYGTTTLLQALYDTRDDGYSQLLSHGTAALMNAYAMPHYSLRHDAVVDQFVGALSSRTAAAVQGQKFLNANHAYGPDECMT